MSEREKFERFLKRYPHAHRNFFQRPHWTRRQFFNVLGAGITGSFLAQRAPAAPTIVKGNVTMQNKAKNAIFILLAGAPSHVDTFDLKETPGVTPTTFAPTTVNGVRWPTGLMPKLGQALPDIAIARSVRSWAAVHELAQIWSQIGRNPAAAMGDIAPNIGSIVAIEKESERLPNQVFPAFLALNSNQAIGAGYLAASYAPFKTTPGAGGLRNTSSPAGETRFNDRYALLNALDGNLRVQSPVSPDMDDYGNFYSEARGLMYNPVVSNAFRFSTADGARYGNNGFGNACLVAKQVLQANQGTRFIQITLGGWDMHQNIYAANTLPRNATILDDGLSALIGDLKQTGLLNETIIVMAGEFGRTVGALTAQAGRDHFLQQFCMFAGAGIRGGRAIGATNSTGSATTDFGWSRGRDIRPEDIEATLYSALGINWTSVRYDDPFGRGFEYVPFSGDDLYGPINELWS